MRDEFTKERLIPLMKELSRSAPRKSAARRVFLVGGGTAVSMGWRRSSVDVDLFADDDGVFQDIQGIKERLNMNIELARPEDFVPALKGADERHLFIDRVGSISFFHYDPYSQLLSKIVRGYGRDQDDARNFISDGLVDPDKFRKLVSGIPDSSYAKYPNLSRRAVEKAVGDFLA